MKKTEVKTIQYPNEKITCDSRLDNILTGLMEQGIEPSYPEKIVDIETLSREEWLQYRRLGIGGSDAGTILSVNKWSDIDNLYRDKRGELKSESVDWKKQCTFDMGHLAEDVIAKIVEHKMHFKMLKDTWMYKHSTYPWMLADCDYFAYDLDGFKVGIECKYINMDDLKMKWRSGVYGKDAKVGNLSYLIQCRHYMCVMNLDRWYLCVWSGNNPDDIVIIRVDRDYEAERELIIAEDKTWCDIQNGIAPMIYSKNKSSMDKLLPTLTSTSNDKNQEIKPLSDNLKPLAEKYVAIKYSITAYSDEKKALEEQLNAVVVDLLSAMENCGRAIIKDDETHSYEISYLSSGKSSSFDWEGLKASDEDTFEYIEKNGFFTQKEKKPTFKCNLKENKYIKGLKE